jgi:photosystem II stability/assembly factor-like uncharacterized protein
MKSALLGGALGGLSALLAAATLTFAPLGRPAQAGADDAAAGTSGQRAMPHAQESTGFTALQFVDPQHGWLAGLGLILATADGGQTWTPQFSGGDPISSFAFVDARTGWAVGRLSLVGTTSGGQRWEQRDTTDPPLVEVSFASADLGWGVPRAAPAPSGSAGGAALQSARLAATADGGQSWDDAPAPGVLQSICRADADRGWAAGGGQVWRRPGAGTAWDQVLTSPATMQMTAPGGTAPGFSAAVQCVDADTAWVLFTAPGGMMQIGWALYRTGDAGATWTPVAQSGQFFPETGAAHGSGGWNRVRLAAVDGTTAYVVGTCVPCSPPGTQDSGTVSLGVTRDAGQSWQDLPMLPNVFGPAIVNAPFAASFPTAQQGWGIAPGTRALYATTDGGATWTARVVDAAPQ